MLKLTVECDVDSCSAQILCAVELHWEYREYDSDERVYDLHAVFPEGCGWHRTSYGQHRCKKHTRVP